MLENVCETQIGPWCFLLSGRVFQLTNIMRDDSKKDVVLRVYNQMANRCHYIL